MKKRKAGVGSSAGKGRRVSTKGKAKPVSSRSKQAPFAGKGAPKNVDEYLARVPGVAQSRFNEMRGSSVGGARRSGGGNQLRDSCF